RVAAVLLPSILLGDGTVAQNEPRRLADHRPQVEIRLLSFASHQLGEQDRQRHLVELHAAPVRRPVEPHVLPPRAVRLLRAPEVAQRTPREMRMASREEAAGALDEIARPDEVIAAELVVTLRLP